MKKRFGTRFQRSCNFNCISAHKTFAIILFFLCAVAIFAGVISAIRFSSGILPINFSNVVFINFLKSKSSWMWLMICGLFTCLLFSVLFILFFANKFTGIFAIIFLLYYLYARILTLVSMLIIYGFINTFILFLVLLLFTLAYCVLYVFIMLALKETRCSCSNYFKNCFNMSKTNIVLPFILILLLVSFLESVMIGILKTFVIILVF